MSRCAMLKKRQGAAFPPTGGGPSQTLGIKITSSTFYTQLFFSNFAIRLCATFYTTNESSSATSPPMMDSMIHEVPTTATRFSFASAATLQ